MLLYVSCNNVVPFVQCFRRYLRFKSVASSLLDHLAHNCLGLADMPIQPKWNATWTSWWKKDVIFPTSICSLISSFSCYILFSVCFTFIIHNFFLNWINFFSLQEKRIAEERLRMQKDFEEEQEKSRRKEEEVQCSSLLLFRSCI